MPSSGIWRCVGLVRIDVLEEGVAYIFSVKTVHEVGTAVAVTSGLNCSVSEGGAVGSCRGQSSRHQVARVNAGGCHGKG
jgi:hypothetical protein